jgi:hypothetical protein
MKLLLSYREMSVIEDYCFLDSDAISLMAVTNTFEEPSITVQHTVILIAITVRTSDLAEQCNYFDFVCVTIYVTSMVGHTSILNTSFKTTVAVSFKILSLKFT